MRCTLFGESHGPGIGVVLEGVPAGLTLDMDEVLAEMARRAPGKSAVATARREADAPRIISGLFEGRTTGSPLCALIENTDARSSSYAATRFLARPGHADYTGFVRYAGCNDYRGGGHFSGRITAPLVFAGAVAKQLLRLKGIRVFAHILEAAGIADAPFDAVAPDEAALAAIAGRDFPVLDEAKGQAMREAILAARADGDSVGGVIEGMVTGLEPGLGGPDLDDTVEGLFARQLFAVPAVKGVAFGAGFGFAAMRGSAANDAFYTDAGGRVRTRSNHNGGINGGITNGMPLLFTAAVKPTPSIALPQETIDLRTRERAEIRVSGRHDPCILPRAVPVIEAAAALAAAALIAAPKGAL